MNFSHLTDQDHAEAARLLVEIQGKLDTLTRIVDRVDWSERVMRVKKAVQERLIDLLREAHDASRAGQTLSTIYPSVYYAIGRVR